MPGTNPVPPVVDDDKPVTEDDLRALKYPEEGVDPPKEEDEPTDGEDAEKEPEEAPDESDQITDPEPEEEAPADPPAFVKEFDYIKGDTPEEYAKNLEAAYKNSSSEALRLKGELDATKVVPPPTQVDAPASDDVVVSPVELYVQQQIDTQVREAFTVIQTDYPQVNDPAEYQRFTNEVATFSTAILGSQKRLASPAELYTKAAISLGWEKQNAPPDDKDKLGMALKDGAAASKPTSASIKPKATGPKVSEEQLKLNRKMYPGKTDQEIIEELTPYIQQ